VDIFQLKILLIIRQIDLLTLSRRARTYFRVISESFLYCRLIPRLTTFKMTDLLTLSNRARICFRVISESVLYCRLIPRLTTSQMTARSESLSSSRCF